MSIIEIKKAGRIAQGNLKIAKAMIKGIVTNARMLMDETDRDELTEIFKEAGSDVATIEQYLNEFGRFGSTSKKFVVMQNKVMNVRLREADTINK